MGRLLEYVLAHEVGHTLGFQHNMKASSYYAIDSVRNASFVKRMGHTPTLMDYSRFNYVAQPEDKIDVADLVPKIGPYDIWATHWGYAPIENAKTPDDERRVLDTWAREQDAKPWLRFSTSGTFGGDPGEETEAVGDIDAVQATELGMKNLKRGDAVAGAGDGEAARGLRRAGRSCMTGWLGSGVSEMGHVANIVGGVNSQEKYGSQPGPRFTPMSAARQKAAMKYLAENAFQTPDVPDRSVGVAADRVGWGDQSDRAGAGGGAVAAC